MLIDYVKIMLIGISIASLKQSKYLNFTTDVNLDTGEAGRKNYQVAYYKNMQFRIYDSGLVFLMGSLHKLWNDGQHNFNDFSFSALLEVLEDLESKFGITPDQMKIQQIEAGLNIYPPYPTKEILKYSFQHGTTLFKWVSVKDEGRFKEAIKQQYFCKLYDKRRHYERQGFNVGNRDILRWELKYMGLSKLKKYKISTMQDVILNLEVLLNELIYEWDNVLLYDFTIESKSKLLDKYSNPIYWENLSGSLFRKHKRKLKELINTNSQKVSEKIRQALLNKGNELLTRGNAFKAYCKQINNTRGNAFKTSSIDLIPLPNTKPEHKCIITNLPKVVSGKKGKYLTPKDLEYFYKNEPKIYADLATKYLKKNYKGLDYSEMNLTKRFSDLCHNMRASQYNTKNNDANNLKFGTKRKIDRITNEPTLTLWDNMQFIKPEVKQIAGIY